MRGGHKGLSPFSGHAAMWVFRTESVCNYILAPLMLLSYYRLATFTLHIIRFGQFTFHEGNHSSAMLIDFLARTHEGILLRTQRCGERSTVDSPPTTTKLLLFTRSGRYSMRRFRANRAKVPKNVIVLSRPTRPCCCRCCKQKARLTHFVLYCCRCVIVYR